MKSDDMFRYRPGFVSLGTRLLNTTLALALLVYGFYGTWNDGLFLPGRYGPGATFHGISMWMLLGAFVSAAMNLLSVVVCHFDQRNDGRSYHDFAHVAGIVGVTLFFAGIICGPILNDVTVQQRPFRERAKFVNAVTQYSAPSKMPQFNTGPGDAPSLNFRPEPTNRSVIPEK